MIENAVAFIKEAYSELKKVTWLSQQELISSTIVILILVAIISVIVSALDFIFLRFIGWIL